MNLPSSSSRSSSSIMSSTPSSLVIPSSSSSKTPSIAPQPPYSSVPSTQPTTTNSPSKLASAPPTSLPSSTSSPSTHPYSASSLYPSQTPTSNRNQSCLQSTLTVTLDPSSCSNSSNSNNSHQTNCNAYNYYTTKVTYGLRTETIQPNHDSSTISSSTTKDIQRPTNEYYCMDSNLCYTFSISTTSQNPLTYTIRINDETIIRKIISSNDEEQVVQNQSIYCNDSSIPSSLPSPSPTLSDDNQKTITWREIALPITISLFLILIVRRYFHRRRILINERNEERYGNNSSGTTTTRRRRRNTTTTTTHPRTNRRGRRSLRHEYNLDGDDDFDDGNNIFEQRMRNPNRIEDQHIMDERQIRRLLVLKNIIYKRVEKKYHPKGFIEVNMNTTKTTPTDDLKSEKSNKRCPDETFISADEDEDDNDDDHHDDEELTYSNADHESSIFVGEDGTITTQTINNDNYHDNDDFEDISLDETTISTFTPPPGHVQLSSNIVYNHHQQQQQQHSQQYQHQDTPSSSPARVKTRSARYIHNNIHSAVEERCQFQDSDIFNDNVSTRSVRSMASSVFQRGTIAAQTKIVDLNSPHDSHGSSSSLLSMMQQLHLRSQHHQYQSSSTVDSATSSTISALKSCPICMEVFQEGDEVALSKNEDCQHCFHVDCIIHWLMENDECPICRRDYLFSTA